MKRILFGFLGIVVLAIAAIIAVAMFTPKEVYKDRIETAAANALGRDVTLNGDVGLSFLPRIAASIGDVTIANPDGFTDEHLLRAGALRASVKWAPLFAGRVEVSEIAFVDARVSLERLADGQANWEFDTGAEAEPASDDAPPAEINAGIDRARLVNAAIAYRDAVADQSYALTDFNIEASVKSLTQPLTAEGSGIFEGDSFDFDVRLDSPQAILDGETATTVLSFDTALANVSFDGSFTPGDAPAVSGAFQVAADSIAALAARAEIDPTTLPVALGPLGSLSAAGNVSGPLDNLALNFDSLDIDGEAINIGYEGAVRLAETQSVNGKLTLSLANAATTINALGLDIPQAGVLGNGTVTLTSALSGTAEAIEASEVDLNIASPLLDMTYTGRASTTNGVSANGRLTLTSEDVHALALASGMELPASQTDPIRDATLALAANVAGTAEAPSVTGIDLDLTGPLVSATYDGDLSLAGDGSLNGQLTASSDDLRALLAAAAVELAPGETLNNFSISANASGAFNRLAVSDLNLAVDEMTGTGNLTLRTDTPRPIITGALSTGPLDLTPFMGPPPENQPEGWSKTPLALDSLKAADADITLNAASLTIDKITLSDAQMAVKLTNGVLDADIDQFKAFGGNWNGEIGLDASAATPALTMTMAADSILMEQIMLAFANTDRLAGGGQFQLNLTGRGESIDAIMNSLNGDLRANLADGALKGVNLGQLIRTSTDLRSSLTSGGFNLGLSPGAQSDFTNFNSVLNIRNGVANIELMEMVSTTFGANGLGQINLGQQTLDMALRVAADKSGRGELAEVQLNNVGIPLRITGGWAAPKIVPDTGALTQLLAGQALGGLGGGLGELISGGGDGDAGSGIGDVLSGVLGGRAPATPAQAPEPAEDAAAEPDDAADGDEPEDEPEPETVEDAVEDLAKEALGGLFGRRKDD